MKKALLVCLLMIAAAFSSLPAGGAQDSGGVDVDKWPSQAITMTCPWAAGGLADLFIRAIAEYGDAYFGVPIVPVVRTGAGGAVAVTEFKKHKPNDPQLIMASEGLFAITPLTNEVAFSWEDYVPVIGANYSAFSLVSRTRSPISSMSGLLEYGKTHTVTVAITGDNLLFVGAFFDKAGISYRAVPYGGAAEQLAAVLSGDVDLGVTHPSLAKEHAKAGTIVPLFVFDDEAWQDDFFNIPPVTEYGFDVVFPNHNFLLMPAGTDPGIIRKVHEKISAIYREPAFIEFTRKVGLVVRPSTTTEIEAHIANAVGKAKEYYSIVYRK